MKWISVEERLPAENMPVFLYCTEKGDFNYFRIASYFKYPDGFISWNTTYKPTHWMPLPAKPAQRDAADRRRQEING